MLPQFVHVLFFLPPKVIDGGDANKRLRMGALPVGRDHLCLVDIVQ